LSKGGKDNEGPSFTYNIRNQTTNIGSDSSTSSGASQQERAQVNTDTFVYTELALSTHTDQSVRILPLPDGVPIKAV
jgi:hypothetical protein